LSLVIHHSSFIILVGKSSPHSPVLLILAAFSRHDRALDWTRETAERSWGPVALESERFVFDQTDYYQGEMGEGLRKTFLAFEQLIDPSSLVAIKHQTNQWEAKFAQAAPFAESRPLNLDPGYITSAKFVLASTKDHCHRIYLSDGIYAEMTLYYQRGQWCHRDWTYPDYRTPEYQEFFMRCREYLRERLTQPH
jgi:hypothetical protein